MLIIVIVIIIIIVIPVILILMLCCQFTVRYKEHVPNAQWSEVEPGACVPFWPSQAGSTKQLVASIKGTDIETKPFDITDSHITLLQLYHDVSAISVC